ncbi:MAG: hypothetical protein JWM53_2167, partial [bacterium]|nr:hypothetical protein [bacterium]
MREIVTGLIVVLCSFRVFAAPPTVAIPDTPAGHVLQAYLDAFNSGDAARIKDYCARFNHPVPPERMTSFARQVGGFDLVSIRSSEPRRIGFLVKEKNGTRTAVGNLLLAGGEQPRIEEFRVRAIPPGMRPEDLEIKVDAASRARILDGVAAKLTEFYIYPEIAKKMIDSMRAQQKKGAYGNISDGDTLAFRLTKDLQAVSHDGHLRVFTSPEPLPQQDPGDDDPPTDADRA